ncbi:DUF4433 domain-containing protein [Exiguobacterium sp. SH5S13]|uniref:DarT ssDNA thymidine ADP-ribosyltransferase family protein n=1 Tax=Exiguobacterium sp. SH5S13 TaxID=2510959 RepID=UPI00103A247B|nr:DarT ssDNA thymidine ADP-ribosyltransferase family protein [Exiguobacterium sp. SH5S13]TCI49568.1 DUF4433 domain-containing protein [Exiguobacterium sp. SH5S13]
MDEMLIREEYLKRNITRLCHITRSQKAVHILSSEDGITAVDFLDEALYEANDPIRLDGKKEYINCSLQYPNHWYWRRIKDINPLFKDWVILLINPELLTYQNTLFCPVNAAKKRGGYITRGHQGFKSLFSSKVESRSRTLQMMSNCPTDDQAEILIYKNVRRKDILGVIVESEDRANSEFIKWKILNIPQVDIFIAPSLFDGSWSTMVRQGIVPIEKKYQGGV